MKRLGTFLVTLLLTLNVRADEACIALNSKSTSTDSKNKKQIVSMATTASKPVVVYVYWASWCTYCKRLTSVINKYNQTHRQNSVEVIAISLDSTLAEAKSEASELFPKNKNSYFCPTAFKEDFKYRKLPYTELYHNGKLDTVYEGFSGDRASYMKKRFEWLSSGSFDHEDDEDNQSDSGE